MRPISNWQNVKPATIGSGAKLPADGYVCKIKTARVEQKMRADNTCFEMLSIAFDIYEGEYAGYFEEQFNETNFADKKWKGVIRQMIPTDDGSEKDEKIKSFFKGAITAIEESNPGYHFDFDEKKLAGKLVGIVFREEEYDYEGRRGMAVKPFVMTDVHKIANGEYTVPKPKMLQSNSQIPQMPYSATPAVGAVGASEPYPSPYMPLAYQETPTPNFETLGTNGDDLPF